MGKAIKELDLTMQPRATEAFNKMCASDKLKEFGVEQVAITETFRLLTTQMAYYSRGRMDPPDVKRMYAAAGLYTPTEEECKTKNTWTLQSKHLEGKAIDFVPIKDEKPWWNAPKEVWEIMGEIGEECGLSWGGRWNTPDYPHFEI